MLLLQRGMRSDYGEKPVDADWRLLLQRKQIHKIER